MLESIYQPIQEDLVKVEEELKSLAQVKLPWMTQMIEYSLSGGGKRIRPGLTLLAGKFYDYNLEILLPMAAAVELMHTATLVHDDAIDKSMKRRGRPTINSRWGDEKAILLGDYLFARAGEYATYTNNLYAVRIFTQTLASITCGEISQSFNSFNLNQTREDYLFRITRKTASLFTLATESGAVLSKAPESSIQALKEYGFNLGIAFQIVDDILDYIGTEKEMGKPVASDLLQGTLTLPSMLLLEHYPESNPIHRLFKSKGQDEEAKKQAVDMVLNSNIIEESYRSVDDYCVRACKSLDILPDSTSLKSMKLLAEFTAKRRN